jgi:hypothetical protein
MESANPGGNGPRFGGVDTRSPTSASAMGDDPPTGQTTAPMPTVTPPRSGRADGRDEPPADEPGAVGGPGDEQDNAPVARNDPPAEEKQEEARPVGTGSVPPELEELRGEPALKR